MPGNPGCRKQRPIECSAHGGPPRHPHRAHSGNQYHLPLRGNPSSRAENFGQLDLMKPVPTWRIDTTTVGFEVKECPLLADTASWSRQRWESCQPSSTTMRKVKASSDCRSPRHTGRMHAARCVTFQNRTSGRSFRLPATTHLSDNKHLASLNTDGSRLGQVSNIGVTTK